MLVNAGAVAATTCGAVVAVADVTTAPLLATAFNAAPLPLLALLLFAE
jgi:hypothetical protein